MWTFFLRVILLSALVTFSIGCSGAAKKPQTVLSRLEGRSVALLPVEARKGIDPGKIAALFKASVAQQRKFHLVESPGEKADYSILIRVKDAGIFSLPKQARSFVALEFVATHLKSQEAVRSEVTVSEILEKHPKSSKTAFAPSTLNSAFNTFLEDDLTRFGFQRDSVSM